MKSSVSFAKKVSKELIFGWSRVLVPLQIMVALPLSPKFGRYYLSSTDYFLTFQLTKVILTFIIH